MFKWIRDTFCTHKDMDIIVEEYQIYTSKKYVCKKCGYYYTNLIIKKAIEKPIDPLDEIKYSMRDVLKMKIWNIKDRHTLELNLPELCKIYSNNNNK